jgi:hypothetical protein
MGINIPPEGGDSILRDCHARVPKKVSGGGESTTFPQRCLTIDLGVNGFYLNTMQGTLKA